MARPGSGHRIREPRRTWRRLIPRKRHWPNIPSHRSPRQTWVGLLSGSTVIFRPRIRGIAAALGSLRVEFSGSTAIFRPRTRGIAAAAGCLRVEFSGSTVSFRATTRGIVAAGSLRVEFSGSTVSFRARTRGIAAAPGSGSSFSSAVLTRRLVAPFLRELLARSSGVRAMVQSQQAVRSKGSSSSTHLPSCNTIVKKPGFGPEKMAQVLACGF